MDLNELFKDVTSFNKEAAMKENMRMVELKDSVTAQAFRDAHIKLASYVNVLKIDLFLELNLQYIIFLIEYKEFL